MSTFYLDSKQQQQKIDNDSKDTQSSDHPKDHPQSLEHQTASTNQNTQRTTQSRQNSTSSLHSVDKSGHNSSTSSLDQQQQIYQPSSNSRSRVANLFTRMRKQDQTVNQSSGKKCLNCRELEDQIITLNDDLNALENEIYGNKEVIKVLNSQIESLTIEKETYQRVCNSLTIDNLQLSDLGDFVQKECELSECKNKIKKLEDQILKLNDDIQQLNKSSIKLKKDNKLLEDMLQIKDQSIQSLTNEIFNLEKGGGAQWGDASSARASSFSSYLTANSFPSSETYVKPQLPKLEENEREKLKDSVTAFQAQNQFLNREIIELNANKKDAEVKIQKLEWTVVEWEAKCACIQSKLLSLLKEINHNTEENEVESNENDEAKMKPERSKSIAQNESIKQLVQRLLDDDNSLDIPHSWRNSKGKKQNLKGIIDKSSSTTIIEYDELGFQNKITQDNNELDDLFDKDDDIAKKAFDEEEKKEWKAKWDSFISTISNSERLTRTNELKLLLRSGVPQDYR